MGVSMQVFQWPLSAQGKATLCQECPSSSSHKINELHLVLLTGTVTASTEAEAVFFSQFVCIIIFPYSISPLKIIDPFITTTITASLDIKLYSVSEQQLTDEQSSILQKASRKQT